MMGNGHTSASAWRFLFRGVQHLLLGWRVLVASIASAFKRKAWTWRPHVVKLVKPPAKESKEIDSQYPEPMAPHRSTRDTKQIHRTKEKWE